MTQENKAFLRTFVPWWLRFLQERLTALKNPILAFLPIKINIERGLQARYKHGFIWLTQCFKNMEILSDVR